MDENLAIIELTEVDAPVETICGINQHNPNLHLRQELRYDIYQTLPSFPKLQ